MKKVIFYILIILNSWLFADFNRISNGIVIDTLHKLQWQDIYIDREIKHSQWKEAIDYCENLDLGGYDDWRLPNVNELLSLYVENNSHEVIDPNYPQNTHYVSLPIVFENVDFFYWSSTTSPDNETDAFVVESRDLIALEYFKFRELENNEEPSCFGMGGNYCSVRCVRDGQ